MATRAIKVPGHGSKSDWVFLWQKIEPPLIPRLIALGFGLALFGFLIGTVRVQIDVPEKPKTRKASLIYLSDDAEGRAWALRAKEGGPFPSRFELAQWQGLAELESSVMEGLRVVPPASVSTIPDLPRANQLESLGLASKGEVILPSHQTAVVETPELIQMKQAPSIQALAGISPTGIPTDLPTFPSPIEPEMSAVSWRFLLRLDSSGAVSDCVSLMKSGLVGASVLDDWLAQISFPAEPGVNSRWIAVSVAFTNQPVDGTEAR